MDPVTLTALATSVLSVITPYVTKTADEFTKLVGEAAFAKAKSLFAALKNKFAPDSEAASTLAHFEQKPERYAPVVKDILSEKLAADPAFKTEVEQRMKDLGPVLEVVQRMKEADGVVGIQANRISGGNARVTQDIDESRNVIGMKIDNIG